MAQVNAKAEAGPPEDHPEAESRTPEAVESYSES
jgi:hypothetical protein